MSFLSGLLPELRAVIAQSLDMKTRHALARTCRFLLAEDNGAATRLPEAWIAHLREPMNRYRRARCRKFMWTLHALEIPQSAKDGNWLAWTDCTGSHVGFSGEHGYMSLYFQARAYSVRTDGGAFCTPIFIYMTLPLPTCPQPTLHTFIGDLTSTASAPPWLLDTARTWLTKQRKEPAHS